MRPRHGVLPLWARDFGTPYLHLPTREHPEHHSANSVNLIHGIGRAVFRLAREVKRDTGSTVAVFCFFFFFSLFFCFFFVFSPRTCL